MPSKPMHLAALCDIHARAPGGNFDGIWRAARYSCGEDRGLASMPRGSCLPAIFFSRLQFTLSMSPNLIHLSLPQRN